MGVFRTVTKGCLGGKIYAVRDSEMVLGLELGRRRIEKPLAGPKLEQENHMEKLIANDPKTRSTDKYKIILYWSNDDDAFVAEVPEFPGCMAHGNTQEDALRHVNQAMALWIDTAKEFGDPIPEPKGERLMLA